MAFTQELCNDTPPPFLIERRCSPLSLHRIELLVNISVLALRDSLLETLLEQTVAGLHTCGGQRGLLFRQSTDEPPTVYAQGDWQALSFETDCNKTLHTLLATLAQRVTIDGLDNSMAATREIFVLPDDSLLLLLPLLVNANDLLVLGVFVTQVPDEENHHFLYALGQLLAAALSRREAEIARRAELAHAGRLLLLGEMTSGLIHELNQPLAAIVTYAHGSQRQLEVETPPPAVLRERLDKAQQHFVGAAKAVGGAIRHFTTNPREAVRQVDKVSAESTAALLADPDSAIALIAEKAQDDGHAAHALSVMTLALLIGKQAQFQSQIALLAGFTAGELSRRAIHTRLEMDIAEAAAATSGQQHLLSVGVEVGKHFVAVDIGDERADWHAQRQILPALAVAVA